MKFTPLNASATHVRVHITGIGSAMLHSTLARRTRLAHDQRLINRRKLRGKARARAIARVNAKRLGRQPASRRRATSPRITAGG
jgi:hypothetical protein